MRFMIEKEIQFEAAHRLVHHDGKCARLHGHSWRAIVRVTGNSLHHSGSSTGMLMDFADLKSILQPLVDNYLDHHDLNETIHVESPTCERVAEWIALRVAHSLAPIHGRLHSVTVHETCTSAATVLLE